MSRLGEASRNCVEHLYLMHAPFSPDCPSLGLQLFKPLFFHEVRWICFSTSWCYRTRGIINVQDVITSHCRFANIEVDNMEALTRELFSVSRCTLFCGMYPSLSLWTRPLLSLLDVCWFVSFVRDRLTTVIRLPSSFILISQAAPSEVTGKNLPCHILCIIFTIMSAVGCQFTLQSLQHSNPLVLPSSSR